MLEVPWYPETPETLNDAQLEAAILAIHAERHEETSADQPVEASSQALSTGIMPAGTEAIGPEEADLPMELQEVPLRHRLTPRMLRSHALLVGTAAAPPLQKPSLTSYACMNRPCISS